MWNESWFFVKGNTQKAGCVNNRNLSAIYKKSQDQGECRVTDKSAHI